MRNGEKNKNKVKRLINPQLVEALPQSTSPQLLEVKGAQNVP